jgi:outer membrane protein assembly factor BamB
MRLAVVVAAVLIAAVSGIPHGERRPFLMPGAIATLQPADGLGTVVDGQGDAWVDDRWGERLLRLDRGTGHVEARLPVQGRLALAAGDRATWALQSGGGYGRGLRGPLLRIDPARNRVMARIPLPALGFGLVAQGAGVWVWGPDDLLWVDGRTDRILRHIVLADARGEATGFALIGDQPAVTTADGHLVRYDARTGAELQAVALPFSAPALQSGSGRRTVVTAGGAVAAVDPRTGAPLWRTRLGFRVGAVLAAGGTLWAFGANLRDPGDRIWKLDPASGRKLGSVLLPDFGTTGMAVLDRTLWVTTANGRVLVLPR